ncbi:unnamed protein product, partial [Enterobius vermicularis]|uniref:PWWP domain-containing protein n=1 Tax=Enterobius vermicularis TaxID=51028 RepID=A0A0N4UTW1_ENTVE
MSAWGDANGDGVDRAQITILSSPLFFVSRNSDLDGQRSGATISNDGREAHKRLCCRGSTSLATKYQTVTVRGTITIPAFVQAACSRQQAKVEVIAEGVQGSARLKGDEVDIEPIPPRRRSGAEYAEQETGARKIELGRRFIIGEYKGWIITRDGHLAYWPDDIYSTVRRSQENVRDATLRFTIKYGELEENMERELYAKRRRHWEPDVQSRMETKRTNPEYGRSGMTATISKLYIDEMKNLYLEEKRLSRSLTDEECSRRRRALKLLCHLEGESEEDLGDQGTIPLEEGSNTNPQQALKDQRNQ